MQFLTPHERAEIEALATAPPNANCCLVIDWTQERELEAIAAYVLEYGYTPPDVMRINFVAPAPGPANAMV